MVLRGLSLLLQFGDDQEEFWGLALSQSGGLLNQGYSEIFMGLMCGCCVEPIRSTDMNEVLLPIAAGSAALR